MVIEEWERENIPAPKPRERAAQAEDASPRMGPEVAPLAAGLHKCPYLAGRPPCGTHHLFPSGTNVCWAEPGEEKPYRVINRGTQDEHCFGGSAGQQGCERYRHAVAQSLPLPKFERPPAGAPPAPEWALPERRRPRRRRETGRSSFWAHAVWLVPLCLTAFLLLLALR